MALETQTRWRIFNGRYHTNADIEVFAEGSKVVISGGGRRSISIARENVAEFISAVQAANEICVVDDSDVPF